MSGARASARPAPVLPETVVAGVHRLVLVDFRNHARTRIDAPPHGLVVLHGPNGAGKTNVLEALSMLAPGRGLRGVRAAEMTRLGAPAWGVNAAFSGRDGPGEIATGIDPATGPERRVVRIDGRNTVQTALGGALAVLWLTPAMDRLFTEAASGRRRFLDRLVFGLDPGHARRVAAYEKAMRERARLLREGNGDAAWLSGLEAQMAHEGAAIALARADAVARLETELLRADPAFPRASVALLCPVADWAAEAGGAAAAIATRLAAALAAVRVRDARIGQTTVGPHRADLAVTHLDKAMPAATCSTGEQKAMLIALILAEARLILARTGTTPILLLDEVAAHLDAGRRQALHDRLAALGAQTWMTGTDPSLFDGAAATAAQFRVEAGAVCPAAPAPGGAA